MSELSDLELLDALGVEASPDKKKARTHREERIIAGFEEIQKFVDWDKENSAPQNAVLFVGSSTINRWSTASAFPKKGVINRGFGGARTPEVLFFIKNGKFSEKAARKPYDWDPFEKYKE